MEWISVDTELPHIFSGVFQVKLSDGNETKCSFWNDMCLIKPPARSEMDKYKHSHWWTLSGSSDPIFGVTHWMNKYDEPLGICNLQWHLMSDWQREQYREFNRKNQEKK